MADSTDTRNTLAGLGLLGLPTTSSQTALGLQNALASAPPNALAGLGLSGSPATGLNLLGTSTNRQPSWIAVRQRFTQFHKNIELTSSQKDDALTKCGGVIASLNRNYYGNTTPQNPSFLIGSWAKQTTVRPPRDVDMYFVLPPSVYHRFQERGGNRQSALLQEVKNVLAATNPNTAMRGDGQVVLVNFESYAVEVAPVFLLENNRYFICNTHDGGSYKETDPWAETSCIETADKSNNLNLRPLIRMLKVWQKHCSVPIKSFQLELLAIDFLAKSPWRLKDFFWFDWIIRDFFAYLQNQSNSFVTVPGTNELIFFGNQWQSRAKTAYDHATKACRFEEFNIVSSAGEEWQKVFGQEVPRKP